jgi:AraC family transcriptional regulator
LAAHEQVPSRELASSSALGWRSVLARSNRDPVETDGFTTAPTPDLLVVIGVSGTFMMECQRPRGWSRVTYRPGAIGVTEPGTSSTLRWRGASPRPVSVHLHLSAGLLRSTAEALGSPRLVEHLPDALLFEDPTVLGIGLALATGLEQQADPLYADSLAQALAAHLLYGRFL